MEQSNFQFVLPSIGSEQMSTNNQGALLVNQAAAAIVSSYLDYAASLYQNIVSNQTNLDTRAEELRITPAELPAFIDSVQNALRNF